MEIRRSILFLAVLAALLVALALWYGKKKPVEMPTVASTETNIALPGSGESRPPVAAPVIQTNAPAVNMGAATIAVSVPRPPAESKAERMREALSTYNDVPIDFYGKLQDQFGKPVSGAEITGSIIYDNGSSNGVREIRSASDASGLFELHGGNGETLSVNPRKEGYVLSGEAGFKYSHFYPESRHIADPTKPTVIQMWRLQGAETLTHFEISTYVEVSGPPYHFDLYTGKRTESGGDIVVRIEGASAPNVLERYDWKASIQAVGGGVITCSGVGLEKMFLAPESGYQSEFVVDYDKNSQPSSSRFNRGFYFTSRNGATYGKPGIAITTDVVKRGAVPITIAGYLNPAGSRNLEVNPALVKEAGP